MTEALLEASTKELVYVRAVDVNDLSGAVRKEAEEGGMETLYALHRADGEQVALVGDRMLAFSLARQNQLTPVSVH
ncbi:DUF1150 family protein [Jannaschia seohaensis]|uniref:DUF1150 family protein n=1 Tax=Jannaschia seohaensis TaxID=475081 RepID=A0A2Y9B7L1_9RHOB|nr:DUF1150 family protein [Jannaschia seohaensis]PWJ14449.1 hypothetical protein BCF38_11272 [Jannaschia seohaensis]SSA50189.1 hypothetical protein SAMN05421539_11272 [Jannaschia seohaensis]